MFKTLRLSAVEEMTKIGSISITIDDKWSGATSWSAVPAKIVYWLNTHNESVFSCYYTRERATLQLANLEPTEIISDKKAMVDAYLYVALKGLIDNAKSMRIKRLVIDSYIPGLPDHMLDLGFNITPRGSFGATGCRGCKVLEV